MIDKLEEKEKELGTDKKQMLVSGKKLTELDLEGWIGRDTSGCLSRGLGNILYDRRG